MDYLDSLLLFLFNLFIVVVLLIATCWLSLRLWIKNFVKKEENPDKISVAFFHPYCNAGGGGERVLWIAIKALQEKYPQVNCHVYTGDSEISAEEILQNVEKRFNIILPEEVNFIFLKRRKWVEAYLYPYFTLLGQSLGSLYLGWEALLSFVPDVYVDSMGYAFTYPLFKILGNCRVLCYVHYPTISTDMLDRVVQRTQTYNNRGIVAKYPILSTFKLWYYRIFSALYGLTGRFSDVVMVNSTWTKNHIDKIWKIPERTNLVYPPCDIEEFESIPLDKKAQFNSFNILSIAQFRPEKDHPLQIRSLKKLLQKCKEEEKKKIKLILMGSCRNKEDLQRVEELQLLSQKLNVEDNVEFKINVSFKELKMEMEKAIIGIHTMWNEHFGIGIVESMAAGLIVVAHCSGGPKMDIVKDFEEGRVGFLADDEESYAECILNILKMPVSERTSISRNARNRVKKFSNREFEKSFLYSVQNIFIK
ncbi:GDP-Man:Man(3)GlcNAc(2)-PP-Dol alpha-1,2-mannosyltransferase [Centruroides vittatus]|uniref:GDP-Man:Man(3)GlcNAc(2)-PP-Dol alpha-1,2-mannosyltransferase n=1 Tax=Centruroides vittatus TaxID=120091 RepID=UPI00350EC407